MYLILRFLHRKTLSFKIMGNSHQQDSSKKDDLKPALLADPSVWMEGAAIAQLEKSLSLPHAVAAFGMPDLHPGKGIPIGCCLVTKDGFYPHLAGNDLGCGMMVSKLSIPAKSLKPEKLAKHKWFRDPPRSDYLEPILQNHPSLQHLGSCEHCFGTIGGGNHFAEILAIDESFDDAFLSSLGIEPGDALLLTHSGSRSMGEKAARQWTDQFAAGFAAEGSEDANHWLTLHNGCLDWARGNRLEITARVARDLGCDATEISDHIHNAIIQATPEEALALGFENQTLYLHRKGASPADGRSAVLPGSRGDYSWLLEPQATSQSGFSLAHGAGRKWKRSDCKDRLKDRFQAADFQRTKLGSRVVCEQKELLFEEAPQAYKDSESVAKSLESFGLATLKARLKPLLTLKI